MLSAVSTHPPAKTVPTISSHPSSPLLHPLVACQTTHGAASQIFATAFARSLFSIQRDSCPLHLPSPNDSALSLLRTNAIALLLTHETPSPVTETENAAILGSLVTVDPNRRLHATSVARNAPLRHL